MTTPVIIISYEDENENAVWVQHLDDIFFDLHTSPNVKDAGHFDHADAKIILGRLRRLGYNNPQGRICGAAWREAAHKHMAANGQL